MSNRFELQDYFGDKTIRGWGVYGKIGYGVMLNKTTD